MIFRNKYMLFSLIGLVCFLPISSQASNSLISLFETAKSAYELNKQYNPHPHPQDTKNRQFLSQSSSDIRTPNLCPQHYPLGYPIVVSIDKEKIEKRSFYLCQDDYAVQFDPATKTPIWVSESLKGEEQAGERIERVNNFQPNPNVPQPAQASLNDYKGSKFDRGHNAPALI